MIDELTLAAISSVGFPIVAFFLMWKLTTSTIKENTMAVRELVNEIRQNRYSGVK